MLSPSRPPRAYLKDGDAECLLCRVHFKSLPEYHLHRDLDMPFALRRCLSPAQVRTMRALQRHRDE